MMLGEDMMIRPLETENWCEVIAWCRDYNRWNKYPVPMLQRFGIGVYQIHQAMEWADLLNKAESYMASFLHFQMTMELMDLGWAGEPDLTLVETRPLCSERALYLISKLQQQCFYKTRMMKTQRGSRFNQKLTAELFAELQTRLVSAVPSYLRKAGLFHASKIMSGTL
jgi:hypothetical protein